MDIGKKIYYRAVTYNNFNLNKIGKSRNLSHQTTFKSLKLKNLGIDLALQLKDKS